MGLLDRLTRNVVNSAERGISKAIGTVVEDKILDVVAPKANEHINKNTQMLQDAANNLGSAASNLGSATNQFAVNARFCTNCGAAYQPDMKFCTACGAKIQPVTQMTNNGRSSVSFTDRNLERYFEDILTSEFGSYEVKRSVSPTTIGGDSKSRDYNFGLYQNGTPKILIMLTDHNRDANRAFLGAKSACKYAGIPFLNFYTHFRNDRAYVIDRIRNNIAK